MPRITRDQLLAKPKLQEEVVPVPALGGDVLVRELTAKERDEFDASNIKRRGGNIEQNLANIRARLCVRACVDPKLTEADIVALGDQRASVVDPIYGVAARLSGITKADEDELAGKNSEAGPVYASPTA